MSEDIVAKLGQAIKEQLTAVFVNPENIGTQKTLAKTTEDQLKRLLPNVANLVEVEVDVDGVSVGVLLVLKSTGEYISMPELIALNDKA